MLLFLGCAGPDKPGDSPAGETGAESGEDSAPDSAPDSAAVETCNGMDDDGDGEVDEGVLLHVDADGDGFGDPEALACEGVKDANDCDDADADVHPGAPEWCDGVSTSCGGDDAGLVTWTSGDERVDWSTDWATGTPELPYAVDIPAAGALHVCEGTWYVAITSATPLTMIGHGAPVLHGGGLVTPVTVLGNLAIEGLEVSQGAGEDGGGVHVEGSTLSLVGVTLSGNRASRYGGGLYAAVDLLDARDVVLAANEAARGGGAWLTTFQAGGAPDRVWSWEGATFDTNRADLFGAIGALGEGTTRLTVGSGAGLTNEGYQGGGFLGFQCGAGAACEVDLGAGLQLQGNGTTGVGGDVYGEALGSAGFSLRHLAESADAYAIAGGVVGIFADHAGSVSVELGGLVSAPRADGDGGAVLLEGGNVRFEVAFTGEVRGASAGGEGAALYVREADVTCDGGLLHASSSAGSSGAISLRDGALHAAACDLGAGADENFGDGVPSDLMGLTYGDATTIELTCAGGACAP